MKTKTKQLVLDALFQKKRKLDETDDERPVQSKKKLDAGRGSLFVGATMNLAVSSTKPNSQGTISSIDTTTQLNSEESRVFQMILAITS